MDSSVPESNILVGHEFERCDAVSVSSSPRVNLGTEPLQEGGRKTSSCWGVENDIIFIPESCIGLRHGLKMCRGVDPDSVSSSSCSGG